VESHFVPRLGWLGVLGEYVGLREETVLFVAWACLLVAAAFCLDLPVASLRYWRGSFIYVQLSGGFVSYGMDNFMTIGLFYLMLSPLPDRYSLDWRLKATI
jgi:hypothetical protein